MSKEFPGNPGLYRRMAIWSTIGMLFWLYGGTLLLQHLWHGETSLLSWQPAVIALVFALWYSRMAYRWMMRLDARFGKGSGWQLLERSVKLPELRD